MTDEELWALWLCHAFHSGYLRLSLARTEQSKLSAAAVAILREHGAVFRRVFDSTGQWLHHGQEYGRSVTCTPHSQRQLALIWLAVD